MEMAKIDAQLKLKEQKIQIQVDMEKARLAQDNEWHRMMLDTGGQS